MADRESAIFKFLENLFSTMKGVLEDAENDENIDKEIIEFNKGLYHTKIITLFDKNGENIGTITECNLIKQESKTIHQQIQELEEDLETAIENEWYDEAARLSKEIDTLKSQK